MLQYLLLVIVHTYSRQVHFKLKLASICHPNLHVLFCQVAIATWQNMARQNSEVLPTTLALTGKLLTPKLPIVSILEYNPQFTNTSCNQVYLP
jgi:hypothetical protein